MANERKKDSPLGSDGLLKGGFYSTQLKYATSYKYTNPNKLSYIGSFQKSNKPLPPASIVRPLSVEINEC